MPSAAGILQDTKDKMAKTVSYLHEQFSGIRTGKASPALVENVQVAYYGSTMRLKEIAGISTPEPRLIVISAFDPNVLPDVEKAILAANLGVTPMNDGRVIRVPIPELTEERRKELTKVAKRMAEEARVALRNVRREANEHAKAAQKAGQMTEDDLAQSLKDVQTQTDNAINQVDDVLKKKEAEIMSV